MPDRLKTRATLASYRTVVVAVCLALVLAGGWATYAAYADPGTQAEERTVASWESTAAFDHRAEVTRENSLYETGRVLKNRPAYFTNVSPVLDGTFVYSYDASDGGDLAVTSDATLVLQQVEDERDGNTTVLWETTEPLDSASEQGVAPGESVAVPFSFDAAALADRAEEIEDDLANPPGERKVFVAVTVDLEGTVNGERVDRTERYDLPLTLGDTLRVDDPGQITERHERTETVLVAASPSVPEQYGGPVLLLLGLLGLLALAVADRRGYLTIGDTDRERLAHAADRSDFDEWISIVSLPPVAENRSLARADSLADLVDFAIDTNNGVVEDPETGVYSVLHDDLRYVYTPPDAEVVREPARLTRELPPEAEAIDLEAVPSRVRTDGEEPTTDEPATDESATGD